MNRRFFLKSIAAGVAASVVPVGFIEIDEAAPKVERFIRFANLPLKAGETYTGSMMVKRGTEWVRLVQTIIAAPGQRSIQFEFEDANIVVKNAQVEASKLTTAYEHAGQFGNIQLVNIAMTHD